MNVWTYWEGSKPEFIDLCLRSMAHSLRNEDFHLVTPDTLHEYINPETIHPNYKRLLLGSQVGCIRAALLAEYGGWWFDADTVGIRSPRRVLIEHNKAKALYCSWRVEPYRILNGYIYLNQELASEWLERINWKLEYEFDSIKWCTLGEGILTPMLDRTGSVVRVLRKIFLPIDVDSDVEDFFKGGNPISLIADDTVCFGLNHSYMMYHHKESMTPPWDKDLLIHQLFQFAEEQLS